MLAQAEFAAQEVLVTDDEWWYRQLLTENYGLVVRIVRGVARRYRLTAPEHEELTSRASMKLIENNYAALRSFRGQSSLSTYLTTVIARVLLDYRTECWGRYRPSLTARRLGATAVTLEMLMHRDGLTFCEACEALHTNFGASETAAELAELRSRLPHRVSRRMLGEDALVAVAATAPEAHTETLLVRLERSIADLPPSDQRMLRLRFHDGWTINRIAMSAGLPPKSAYRYFDRLLRQLRRSVARRPDTTAGRAAVSRDSLTAAP